MVFLEIRIIQVVIQLADGGNRRINERNGAELSDAISGISSNHDNLIQGVNI